MATPKRRTKKKDTDPKGELAATMAAFDKRYGDGVIRSGRESKAPERISTGAFILDFALLGGIPEGRISQVAGNRHSGKSLIAMKIAGNAQRQYPDQRVVLLDPEKTFDATWAEKLGVDVDKILVAEPETGEIAVDMAEATISSQETSLLIVDSLAALVPNREVEGEASDSHVGLQSRLIGMLCRKLNVAMIHERMRGHKCAVLFVNQFRTKIGVFKGDNRTLPGGYAVEHFPSITWYMRNKEITGKDRAYDFDTMVENEHSFTVQKNKLNEGPRTGEFRLCRMDRPEEAISTGDIDDSRTLLVYAKRFGIYSGGGTKWTLEFGEEHHVFANAKQAEVFLNDNRDVYRALYWYLIAGQAENLKMPDYFVSWLTGKMYE